MYRDDLAADFSLVPTEYTSICQNRPSTLLGFFPVVAEPAQRDAQLIMRRLVHEYFERRPIRFLTPNQWRSARN